VVFRIERVAIIGVGLIGGSLGMALRRANAATEIVGAGRSEENLREALARGCVDRISGSAREAVHDAGLVIIATTLGATERVLREIAPALGPDAVLTDAGSVKGSVVAAARTILGNRFRNFVPGHPIAGTEHSGAAAAFAELYQNHRVVLTPLAETNASAVRTVQLMWETVGAQVCEMPVERHDAVLAATSHLPHMLAFSLMEALDRRADAETVFDFAAGGFRDFSRIASSNPEMWSDIALANKAALLEVCSAFETQFSLLQEALAADDQAALKAMFLRAKLARDNCVVPESNVES
jgi:prephenate dehydrogenase